MEWRRIFPPLSHASIRKKASLKIYLEEEIEDFDSAALFQAFFFCCWFHETLTLTTSSPSKTLSTSSAQRRTSSSSSQRTATSAKMNNENRVSDRPQILTSNVATSRPPPPPLLWAAVAQGSKFFGKCQIFYILFFPAMKNEINFVSQLREWQT